MYLRALLPLLLSATTCSAQFVLEHTYPNAATPVSDKQLFMVELEDLGQRYVLFNKTTKTITFFGMDHVQVQLIDLSAVPDVDGFGGDQILYITQYLFDLDPGIELMYIAAGGSGPSVITTIVDESGAVMQSFPDEAAYVIINAPQTQFPIYNTPDGARMILSHQSNLEARVYRLPGDLTTGMITEPLSYVAGAVKLFPNPTTGEVNITVDVTSAFGDQFIRFYSTAGGLLLEQRLTGTTTILPTGRLAAGTYSYVVSRNGVPWYAGSMVKE